MSVGIVELTGERYEAFNKVLAEGGDLGALIRESYDPEIVMEMGTMEGTIRGWDGVERFIEGQAAIIEGLHSEPQEIVEAGERVLVAFRLSGRAKSTGLPVEFSLLHLITLRDGRAVHIQLFTSKSKALQELGSPA